MLKTTTSPTTIQHPPHLQICENCDAPLDGLQRYCVNCGARSRYVSNPALDFLVSKRKPSRLLPKAEVAAGGNGSDKVAGIPRDALPWLAAGISLALIFGVLFGSVITGKGGSDDAALLAALRSQPVAAAATPTGSTAAATTTLPSDFSLKSGYTVQVATIPSSSDQAAADAAKKAAEGKGADKVGLISANDFTLDPAPADNAYAIYSGEFKNETDAKKALAKLKKAFPEAVILKVSASKKDSEGTVLGVGSEGKTAHSIKDYKPSAKKIASDKKAVEDLQNKTGDDYREAQKDLPAEITIPKGTDGGGATGTDN